MVVVEVERGGLFTKGKERDVSSLIRRGVISRASVLIIGACFFLLGDQCSLFGQCSRVAVE